MKALRWLFVAGYLGVASMPLVWLVLTSLKDKAASISIQPKLFPSMSGAGEGVWFAPTLEAYRQLNQTYAGAAQPFAHYLWNSILIGCCSTLCAVVLGTACAYGFSRFRIGGARDWLFFKSCFKTLKAQVCAADEHNGNLHNQKERIPWLVHW